MQQTFYHHMNGKRPITVKINSDYIIFTFPNERDREFYNIPKKEWITDRTERQDRGDNWHNHMMDKTWFNQSIKDFIDKNV